MPPGLFKMQGTVCSVCVRVFKWFPVLFITTIVAWSYYAYVIQLCLFTIENIIQKIFYLIGFHACFAMFAWSYWQTIFTEPGTIPKQFYLSPADAERLEKELSEDNQRQMLERLAKNLPVSCRTMNGMVRYCEKCHLIKPDRAHHCSVCGRCILKMDHHCPWVNNCVSFTNYKYFILFLAYSLIYCLYVAATTLQFFIKFWTNDLEGWGRFHILFLFFVAFMFAISLVSLFGYHCFLVMVNRSTLEAFRPPIFRTGPDKHGFSLGHQANMAEVFGDNRRLWILPVFTSLGDGVTYPTRTQLASSYNSMGSTEQARRKTRSTRESKTLLLDECLGDGVTFPQKIVDEDTDGLLNQRQRWAETDEEAGHSDVTVKNQTLPKVGNASTSVQS
ncbi:palmitoyltransferase ZDHHC20-B-like isoform X2 [Dermacentor silvarum]|uniref:palmitoyltransferase ZDHHC20-B-like isoform X2 n=2 Tax=Dermacentor silvarum TaxID=543639 RepID=UPI0018984831|nr:palmitoyltransferase ZDHHC20-B-like isoform X2 [Dermacentor silvarum]